MGHYDDQYEASDRELQKEVAKRRKERVARVTAKPHIILGIVAHRLNVEPMDLALALSDLVKAHSGDPT